jgi:LmbE family N-acetylglucosaminyl deacetylase
MQGSSSPFETNSLLTHSQTTNNNNNKIINKNSFLTVTAITIALISLVFAILSIIIAVKLTANAVYHDPCMYNPLTCKIDPKYDPHYTVTPERVLVIAAHPDDIETCAGGTLAKWSAAGSEIYYVMITNGDKGTSNHSITEKELGRIRQHEQIEAGRVIGVKDIFFLNVTDGGVTNNEELKYHLTYYVRLIRPTVLLTWNPTYHFSLYKLGLEHSDHRTAGAASLDTVWPTAADFLYFPEQGLPTYRPSQVLMFRFWKDDEYITPEENVFVELEHNNLERKIEAIFQHKSQIKNLQEQEAERQFLTNMASGLGRAVNRKYAEWFTLVRFNQ